MFMSDFEILKSFRTTKDQKKQIKILAELNGCHRNDIIKILRQQGEPLQGIRCRAGKTDVKTDIPFIEPEVEESEMEIHAREEERPAVLPKPENAADEFQEEPEATEIPEEPTNPDESAVVPAVTVGRLAQFLEALNAMPDTPVTMTGAGRVHRIRAELVCTATEYTVSSLILEGE